MKCLVVIFGLLVAAVQAAPGERSSDVPTPLKVYMPLIEGAPKVQAPKIVNGNPAVAGQFPHHGALLIDGTTFCGCSLLSPLYVLTAAHCVQGSSFQIILGRLQWNGAGGLIVMTTNKTVHSGYNPSTLENDIALLRSSASITYTDNIKPVVLPPLDDNTYEGVIALVSGYGATVDNGALSSTLNYADLEIISNDLCSAFYGTIIQPSIICGSGAGGKGTCNGDSGGALVVENSGSYTQIGIVSFVSSAGCGSTYPSGYTRITSFVLWILLNTGL